MTYRCPLGTIQPTTMDTEQIKRTGWRNDRILVVALDDERLSYFQREFVQQIGTQLYGERVIDG